MWPRRKKAETQKSGFSLANPIDRVRTLSNQGLPEPDIAKTMQDEGYIDSEIDAGMKGALKSAVDPEPSREFLPPRERFAVERPEPRAPEGAPPELELEPRPAEPMPPEAVPPRLPEPGEEFEEPAPSRQAPPLPPEPPEPSEGAPPMPPRPEPGAPKPPFSFEEFGAMQKPREPGMPEAPEPMDFEFDDDEISMLEKRRRTKDSRTRELEELTETIIEEKWDMARNDINDIRLSMDNLDSRLASVEQSIDKIESQKKTELQQIDEKIDTYKGSMSEVSGRLEAMETAMKDSLTPMMQSVRSLNETVKNIKTPSK